MSSTSARHLFTFIAYVTLAPALVASAFTLQANARSASAQSRQASHGTVQVPRALIIISNRGFGGENPAYPPDAKKKHIQGTVKVKAVTSKQGYVVSAKAISGPQILREPAVKAVRTWRFEPHLLHGNPVAVYTSITFVYGRNRLSLPQRTDTPPPSAQGPLASPIVRVSGDIMAGNRIGGQSPEYPSDAKEKHIHGSVEVKVLVSKQGDVISANAISGPQILREPAVKTVLTWHYKPYLLGGNPVAVSTIIDVIYKRHWFGH